MTSADMHKMLADRAAVAPAPPADLLERVEGGYRRRHRARAATAAFAAVLMLAGGAWATLRPATGGADLPAAPARYAPLRVPSTLDGARPMTDWPGMFTVDEMPTTAPSGKPASLVRVLGVGRFLMADPDTFYAYDTGARTFRTLVTGARTGLGEGPPRPGTAGPGRVAVNRDWILWQVDDQGAGRFSVFRAPLAGGVPERVAVVRRDTATQGFFATDEFLYWSPVRYGRVERLSLADGTVRTLPEFDGMVVAGTPWARVGQVDGSGARRTTTLPIAFRHVVTGERRAVAVRNDLRGCSPTVCAGRTHDDGREYLMRPDGSGFVWLPYRAPFAQVAENGVVVLDSHVFLDPETGRLGTLPDGTKPCSWSFGAIGDTVSLRWTAATAGSRSCRGGNRVMFIAPGD